MSMLQNIRIKMRIYVLKDTYVSNFRVAVGNSVLINSWIGVYFAGQDFYNEWQGPRMIINTVSILSNKS